MVLLAMHSTGGDNHCTCIHCNVSTWGSFACFALSPISESMAIESRGLIIHGSDFVICGASQFLVQFNLTGIFELDLSEDRSGGAQPFFLASGSVWNMKRNSKGINY